MLRTERAERCCCDGSKSEKSVTAGVCCVDQDAEAPLVLFYRMFL